MVQMAFPIVHLFLTVSWLLRFGLPTFSTVASPIPSSFVRLTERSDWLTPNVGSASLMLQFHPRANFASGQEIHPVKRSNNVSLGALDPLTRQTRVKRSNALRDPTRQEIHGESKGPPSQKVQRVRRSSVGSPDALDLLIW